MKKRIAFISSHNPDELNSWSGTLSFIFNSLKKNYEVTWVQPSVNYTFYKIKRKIYKLIFRKKLDTVHSVSFAKACGAALTKQLEHSAYDVIFAPAASSEIAFLKTGIPIVYYTDAVFNQIVNYYADYSDLSPENIREGNTIEIAALQNSAVIIAASDWTKDEITGYYKIEKNVSVIPFGANLNYTVHAAEIMNDTSAVCKLLFVGKDWNRKGGEIAYQTFRILQQKNSAASLTIVGCQPPEYVQGEKIKVYPFLNKNNPEDLNTLIQLYREATFFILPSKAEAAGIVFCEAALFGLPSLAANTGGISTYVRDEVNGFVFDETADATAYADKITAVLADKTAYLNLRKSAKSLSDSTLNWNSWLQEVSRITDAL